MLSLSGSRYEGLTFGRYIYLYARGGLDSSPVFYEMFLYPRDVLMANNV